MDKKKKKEEKKSRRSTRQSADYERQREREGVRANPDRHPRPLHDSAAIYIFYNIMVSKSYS